MKMRNMLVASVLALTVGGCSNETKNDSSVNEPEYFNVQSVCELYDCKATKHCNDILGGIRKYAVKIDSVGLNQHLASSDWCQDTPKEDYDNLSELYTSMIRLHCLDKLVEFSKIIEEEEGRIIPFDKTSCNGNPGINAYIAEKFQDKIDKHNNVIPE